MSLPPGHDLDDEAISLQPYVRIAWRYRQLIAAAMLAAAVLFGVATLALLSGSPPERFASLEFRLMFAGFEKGRYPNGSAFNPAEIAAEPVVSQVFAANSLDRYVTLTELQQSLSVVKSSQAVRRLDAEYQAELTSPRLTAADRVRLEASYVANRNAVLDPEFDLRLHRSGRLGDIPEPLIETVLSDVLETWAARADAQGGVARPDIDPVSRDMLARAADKSESLVIRADVLRTGAQRLLAALNGLEMIPGARTVRTADNRSLADEAAAVDELIRLDLETLIPINRVAPVALGDRIVLNAYLSKQLVTHRLALQAASARARTMQTVLREYMSQRENRFDIRPTPVPAPQPRAAATPQLTEPFVKELITLAAAAQDREFEYRRVLTEGLIAASVQATEASEQIRYYEDLLKNISAVPVGVASSDVSTRLTAVHDRLIKSVDRLQELSQAVSAQVLNPSRRLYSVTTPPRLQTAPAISTRLLLIRLSLTLIVTFIVAVGACLLHGSRPAATAEAAEGSFEARA